jgi:hypothetical protein
LLRHSSIETTLRYAHVLKDDVAAAMQKAADAAAAPADATLCGTLAQGEEKPTTGQEVGAIARNPPRLVR